ncbi:tRNA (adenosine(37)-N6)-threonylcarbamoyltransferase complex dimerization subunit type 1 TsaB [bacterium]|nr:tRNA (adenosine(37)-N6)-threonylcarbamoyltransferase complex dimerization subunit type 1 TsaB [bacterium]
MKTYLVIDTATKNSSITLMNEELLAQVPLIERGQTKEIIPKIKSLLEEHNLSLTDLEAIAVCVGPGLFTGTRIGVMTAKTLSYGADIPLIPFTTFDLYDKKDPAAILDAKCGRAHLFEEEKIRLIDHDQIQHIQKNIYTIDLTRFPSSNNLFITQKNFKKLLFILEKKTPLSHEQIKVLYS